MSKKDDELPELDARLAALQEPHPDPDCLYHAITLTADDDLNVEFGCCTQWVGFDDEKRFEIRESRLVYADFVKTWQIIGLPYIFVHASDELTLFLVAGGCALVEKELAEGMFPNLLGPHKAVPHGLRGFKGVGLFKSTAFRRAPTPRLRMEVLTRDGRRCRICGRRPDDNIDIELHVHHIRPWARGGVTDPANLITLCHTCHEGLAPHDNPSLYEYLETNESEEVGAYRREHLQSVSNYRTVGFFGNAERKARSRRKGTP